MAQRSVDEIVYDVRVTLDEMVSTEAELEDVPSDEELDIVIKSKVLDALAFVNKNAKAALLEPDVVVSVSSATENGNGGVVQPNTAAGFVGALTLRADYIRLCYAKFYSWDRALGEGDIIPMTSAEYGLLKYPETTGTAARPKVAMTFDLKGQKVLELYSGVAESDVMVVGYMVEPTVTDGGSVMVGDAVYRAMVYYIAGLVMVTYNDQQRAQSFFTQAEELIGFARPGA